MKILGIETSCDETAAAVIETSQEKNVIRLLANTVASSLPLHAKTGGIIPEIAARQQIQYIIPVIENTLKESGITIGEIDAVAVTYGPGLIGSLLVGVETAKTIAFAKKKPLIPVNHLIGHIYANFIESSTDDKRIRFPAIGLVVSGGHTDLVLIKKHGQITVLGGTRDDAAGEAFDKIGRLLGLPYPGGPAIEKASKHGNPSRFTFPRPMIDTKDLDFSFSGLKTAVFREIKHHNVILSEAKNLRSLGLRPQAYGSEEPQARRDDKLVRDISASVQQAILDVLVKKTLKATQKYKVKSILLGGGVAANQALRKQFELDARRYGLDANIFVPPKSLCTDNGAMIAAAGFFNYKETPWQAVTAKPELYY